VVPNVDDLTMPVGTRQATVPRAYLFASTLTDVANTLRAHNVKISTLEKPMRLEGEQFIVKGMRKVRSAGYEMTVLDGAFTELRSLDFPAGSYYVDMAQPMANAAFYYLEPQARDGFVGWGLLDDPLRQLGAPEREVIYPIFKARRELK
jgi:hypothetical protein